MVPVSSAPAELEPAVSRNSRHDRAKKAEKPTCQVALRPRGVSPSWSGPVAGQPRSPRNSPACAGRARQLRGPPPKCKQARFRTVKQTSGVRSFSAARETSPAFDWPGALIARERMLPRQVLPRPFLRVFPDVRSSGETSHGLPSGCDATWPPARAPGRCHRGRAEPRTRSPATSRWCQSHTPPVPCRPSADNRSAPGASRLRARDR